MDTIELGVEYPASTRKPRAASPDRIIHELVDTSRYCGSEVQARYLAAENGRGRRAALAAMPDATVTFYELERGEEFFADMTDMLCHLDELAGEGAGKGERLVYGRG